jgi:hypothetical protein
MMRGPAPRQRFRGTLAQEPLDRPPLGPDFFQLERVCARSGDHDQVDAWRHEVGPRSEAFAAQAFDAVPPDGVPHLAPDDEPQTRWFPLRGLRGHEQGEVTRTDASTVSLRTRELGVSPQPARGPEREPHRGS